LMLAGLLMGIVHDPQTDARGRGQYRHPLVHWLRSA
jgi:hypothetical protein